MTPPARPLRQLLPALRGARLQGDGTVVVSGVSHDSRRVSPGDLFVALRGAAVDGHSFLAEAARRGAAAAVVEEPVAAARFPALIQVPDSRQALALVAGEFWGHPARRLRLVGITGTNGKTTLTYLLESIAARAGVVAGVIGTTGAWWPGRRLELGHTTPEAPRLQQLLYEMVEAGVELVFMEVSSHALVMQRCRALDFTVAVFTNLSRDHLDFHRDLDDYAAAKALLFERELADSHAADKTAVYNADDPAWQQVVGNWLGPALSFGSAAAAQVRAGRPQLDLKGFRCPVSTPAGEIQLESRLPGRHNLQNALAAVAVSLALRLPLEAAQQGIASCRLVPGRLEPVAADDPLVLVDYAHTPGALENVLGALRPLLRGRLWLVFGCGGDRDRGKRPLMGRAAARGADVIVVTSDNPRSESPESIIAEILPGLEGEGLLRLDARQLGEGTTPAYGVEPDRRRAIELAVGRARPGDVVLIAGKGHEDYQLIGGQRHHFDDREEAARAWRLRSAGRRP